MNQRLRDVYDAASFLFITKGYANTQVSQIAERANIATGTVYNLFSGKKSILHFVLLCTFDKQYLDRNITLPIQEVDNRLIIQHLCEVADKLFFKIEGKTENGVPAQSFMDMISIIFDYAAGYQVAFNIINDNRSSLEEVEKVYRQYVNRLYKAFDENLVHYVNQREVRKIELPKLHIRNIVEGITWWSMYLPYQAPDMSISVSKAKEIALDILRHAYIRKP